MTLGGVTVCLCTVTDLVIWTYFFLTSSLLHTSTEVFTLPHLFLMESSYSTDSKRPFRGIHEESTWFQRNFFPSKITWIPQGFPVDSWQNVRIPCRFLRNGGVWNGWSLWSPYGIHMEWYKEIEEQEVGQGCHA